MIPCDYTSIRHVQRAQDHCLGPRYTRVLARSRTHSLSIKRRRYASSRFEITRAQGGAFARAHAVHRIEHSEVVSAMCGSRQDVRNSTNAKVLAICAVRRGARHVSMFHGKTGGGRGRRGKELRTFLTNRLAMAYPPGPSVAVVIQICHTR